MTNAPAADDRHHVIVVGAGSAAGGSEGPGQRPERVRMIMWTHA